jgi:hypothetical protein
LKNANAGVPFCGGATSNKERGKMKSLVTDSRIVATVVALSLAAANADAIDVGDPVYQDNFSGSFRVEVLYENFDRDVELDFDDITVTGPGGSLTIDGDRQTDGADTDLYVLRGTFLPSTSTAVYGDF